MNEQFHLFRAHGGFFEHGAAGGGTCIGRTRTGGPHASFPNAGHQLESADRQLAGKQWIAGFRSFADPYLYITLRWADGLGIGLSDLANLAAFKARMEADPGVQKALKVEGLA